MTFDEMLDHSLMDKEVFFVYSRTMEAVVGKATPCFVLMIFDCREAAEKFMEGFKDPTNLEVRSASLWDYLKDYYGGSDEEEAENDEYRECCDCIYYDLWEGICVNSDSDMLGKSVVGCEICDKFKEEEY